MAGAWSSAAAAVAVGETMLDWIFKHWAQGYLHSQRSISLIFTHLPEKLNKCIKKKGRQTPSTSSSVELEIKFVQRSVDVLFGGRWREGE